MAKKINLTSGSILNGNPITFTIVPQVITEKDADGNVVYPSFHRIIVEVKCGLSTGSYEIIKMSAPIEQEKDGTEIRLDISSALRTLRDSLEYTPYATPYPYVSFNVKAYDEYMLNGEVKTGQGVQYYPSEITYLRTIFGAFPDVYRLASSGSKAVRVLTRRPSTPHLACVGEHFAYTPSYEEDQTLAGSENLTQPTSQVVVIEKEGFQDIGGRKLFAMPASEAIHRCIFRFINSFGVLESISVPMAYSEKFTNSSTAYILARQETFNSFSRAAVKKQSDYESWLFTTDPLDKAWLRWYLHEFLMSEHVWIDVNGNWIPCTLTSEEEITMTDRTNTNMYSVSFTAKLDIYGSPIL